jgi:hypothetical protein
LSAAPYTHAHHAIDSVTDERHPQGETLVHTHASPHSHDDADQRQSEPTSDEDREDRIWSVDSFVFQQPVPNQAPAPVLVVFGEAPIQLTSVWLGADRPQPKAHGPPARSPSGLRGPPVFLPAFV